MPPDLSQPLSAHFTLKELVRSSTAERDPQLKREQENPSDEVVRSLQHLAMTALEPIRASLGLPLQITSGYRCVKVNALIKGSPTSQHCLGEAADCELSPSFLTEPSMTLARSAIASEVARRTGRRVRPDVDQNFYLFAHVCLHLDELDIDQVIHEFGDGFGQPAWVHIAASRRQNKREILFIGKHTDNKYVTASSVADALARCCV